MPNFPTSPWSPPVRSAGNTIDASFFNDPNDEINAIEAGYLNGTARLNSSGSTVATLQAGASTFSVRPVEPPPNAVKVFRQSTVTLGSSAESTISFTEQEFRTNSSMHSTGTNPERLTPQSTGIYLIAAQLVVLSTEAGHRGAAIRDSSASLVASAQVTASSRANSIHVTGLKQFDALGGYVVCVAEAVGASTNSLSTQSWFAMYKL